MGTPYSATTRPSIKTTDPQFHQTTPGNPTSTTAPPQTMPETPANKPPNEMSAMSDMKIPTDTKIAMTMAIGIVFVLVFIVCVIRHLGRSFCGWITFSAHGCKWEWWGNVGVSVSTRGGGVLSAVNKKKTSSCFYY